jgi:nucleolar GTP-binding protein
LTEEQKETLAAIRKKKDEIIVAGRMKRNSIPRTKRTDKTVDGLESHLEDMGIMLSESAKDRMRSRSVSRRRSSSRPAEMKDDEEASRKRTRSESRARSLSIVSVEKGEGFRDVRQKTEAVIKLRKQQKARNQLGKASESDRKVPTKMPKHLFAGKRGNGKTDRR